MNYLINYLVYLGLVLALVWFLFMCCQSYTFCKVSWKELTTSNVLIPLISLVSSMYFSTFAFTLVMSLPRSPINIRNTKGTPDNSWSQVEALLPTLTAWVLPSTKSAIHLPSFPVIAQGLYFNQHNAQVHLGKVKVDDVHILSFKEQVQTGIILLQ